MSIGVVTSDDENEDDSERVHNAASGMARLQLVRGCAGVTDVAYYQGGPDKITDWVGDKKTSTLIFGGRQ